jgi:hypothetical protein
MNRSTQKHSFTKNVLIFRIKVTRKIKMVEGSKEINRDKMKNIRLELVDITGKEGKYLKDKINELKQ